MRIYSLHVLVSFMFVCTNLKQYWMCLYLHVYAFLCVCICVFVYLVLVKFNVSCRFCILRFGIFLILCVCVYVWLELYIFILLYISEVCVYNWAVDVLDVYMCLFLFVHLSISICVCVYLCICVFRLLLLEPSFAFCIFLNSTLTCFFL